MRTLTFLAAAWLAAVTASAAAPHLEKHGSTQQLRVHDKPFLILGGELGNSSASNAGYLQPHWPRLKAMHLNTVLAPVYWELLEPAEGRYDWASVDALLRDARAHELKLVLLWFGAWKNSMSTYVPSWVKRDQARFPRAQLANGSSVEILSVFSKATLDADARAFAQFMDYLANHDARDHTVIMVQVENEIGMLPIARERGATADKLFAGPVPAELMRSLARAERLEPELRERWQTGGSRTSGSWAQVFGDDEWGQEVFTAWHYARFVEVLVKSGKQRYNLPMYVNAALNQPIHGSCTMRRLLVMSMAVGLLALGACQRSSEPGTPAAPAAPVSSAPAGAVVMPSRSYQCGELAVAATFDGVGAVDLSYPGGPLTLPQAEAGSGARYADSQGNEFWSKGEAATFTLAGQEKRNCTAAAPGS